MVLDLQSPDCLTTSPKDGGDNQLWKWVGGATYGVDYGSAIINKTGVVLEIKDQNPSPGASVIALQGPNGSKNQQWKIKGGNIVSCLNGLFLSIKGGSNQSQDEIILWPSSNGDTQSWRFVTP